MPVDAPHTGVPATRQAAWRWGEGRLRAAGLAPDEARLEAEVLLRHAAALTREELFVRPGAAVLAPAASAYAALIDRRAAGRPTAYLVGHREFFGIDLRVDERVLIPRPETERLVEVVRDALRGLVAPRIADIGTGSGAVAIALARALPEARVVATDVSAAVLELAGENAGRAGVSDRIEWAVGPGVGALSGRVADGGLDAMVSNPPYIPTAEVAGLPVEVRAHEPAVALDGGPDGLRVHREIIGGAARYLGLRGVIALEVAAVGEQARAVAALIAARGEYGAPRIVRDYAGAERVVLAARAGADADHRR